MRTDTERLERLTESELIARQAKRIAELEEQVAIDSEAINRVGVMIFGIGGPLNDDRYGCTSEIRKLFSAIADELDIR